MRFDEFPGNTDLKNTLQTLIGKKQFPHCTLFTGEQGSGVFPLALAVTSALFCENNDGHVCGNCKQCKLVDKYTHPDVHFTFPFVLKKKEKETANNYRETWIEFLNKSPFITYFNWLESIDSTKQGIIPVSEIQDIVHFGKMYSYQDGPKVLIIWNADLLGKNGNRLLKLIEEPPDDMYIILIAESKENLLNTIVSRAQHFHFSNPLNNEVWAYLENNYPELDKSTIENAVILADGKISKAIELLRNQLTKQVKMLLPWLRDCYTANSEKLYKWTDTFKSLSKEEQKEFWDYFLHYLKELQRITMGADSIPKLSDTQLKAAENMSRIVNLHVLQQLYDIINEVIYSLQRNGRADLTFLSASLRIHNAFQQN